MASESKYAPKAEQESHASYSNGSGPLDNSDAEEQDVAEALPPNPFLKEPLLFVSGLDPHVTDKDLASGVFGACLPVR